MALATRVPSRLSYSSINTYETCPAKFRFQYEERVPTRPSPALSFGDSLHQTLYHWHNRPVPVPPPLEEMREILDSVWVSDGYTSEAEELTYRDHAEAVLAQYHRENADQFRIPAALYFLFPGQRMTTTRTREHADELRRRIATVAERIAAGKFEPKQNPLCDWCDFQAL